jgi:hypothetical protein
MEIQQPVISIYDAYSISSDEENDIDNKEYEPPIKVRLPSEITINTSSNTSSDTESDDYNENNIIHNNRRKQSFVKKSLKNFSTRIEILPEKLRETMILEKIKSPRLCYIKYKVYGMTILLMLVIISLVIIY